MEDVQGILGGSRKLRELLLALSDDDVKSLSQENVTESRCNRTISNKIAQFVYGDQIKLLHSKRTAAVLGRGFSDLQSCGFSQCRIDRNAAGRFGSLLFR